MPLRSNYASRTLIIVTHHESKEMATTILDSQGRQHLNKMSIPAASGQLMVSQNAAVLSNARHSEIASENYQYNTWLSNRCTFFGKLRHPGKARPARNVISVKDLKKGQLFNTRITGAVILTVFDF